MNAKADELDLIQTRFSNPHGLQNALNVSSAKDVLALSLYASRSRLFREVMNTECKRYECFSDEYKSEREVKKWYNTNTLLGKGWEGVKTGQTLTAGGCLSSLREGVYIVVLNCADADRRFIDTERLFSWYVETREREGLVLPSLDSHER
jgi:serine-type D-Ala-D-Ala carboxypeptidase (penicillin-binding protein 5/6)